ncbi:MAG: hypothetical protein H0W09_03425 [Solirubrobacterales bacterium]|nr:hypothetical protein [Solirubrobacterales bacterium]
MISREATLERERRWARPAGISALLVTPLYFVAQYSQQSLRGSSSGGLFTDVLPVIDANAGALVLPAVLGALSFLAMIAPLVYLFEAARARSERVRLAMIGFAVLAPVLLAIQAVMVIVTQTQIAADFVAQSTPGGDVYTLFNEIVESSTANEIASSVGVPAGVALLVALIYIPLQSMRVGLLSRFMATFVMALAVLTIIPVVPVPAIQLFISLWFFFLGLVILDKVRRARPPAWAAGVAMPWPKPGEPAREPEQQASPEDFTEGRATETTTEPNPNAARRERAKRKKRKRRT